MPLHARMELHVRATIARCHCEAAQCTVPIVVFIHNRLTRSVQFEVHRPVIARPPALAPRIRTPKNFIWAQGIFS
jgi:hypothetical protein